MAENLKGSAVVYNSPLTLAGPEIQVGHAAPDFTAVNQMFESVRLSDAKGKVVILVSVLSVETPVCDTVIRRFDQMAAGLSSGIEIWTVTMDLPFVQKRWCEALSVAHVKMLSDFRYRSFGQSYGLFIKDGPFAGILSRAVFVVGDDGKIKHAEYIKDIVSQPEYDRIRLRAALEKPS